MTDGPLSGAGRFRFDLDRTTDRWLHARMPSFQEERSTMPRPIRTSSLLVVIALAVALPQAASAQSAEEWAALGARVHGGYGAFIPMGIRIGLDAAERLKAGPRELSVTYYSGEKAPCPCIADGIMIATTASPGQGTLRVAAEPSPHGTMGVAMIAHRRTGETIRYTIPGATMPKLQEINKTIQDPVARHHEVMKAADLFAVEPAAPAR
jgi:formylmethanofuran dehydrogenase subunit E